MLMNTKNDQHKNEREIELEAAISTLEVRHLCPSAPDTLRVHPFKESDPFVIAERDLTLDDDDDMADEVKEQSSN